MTTNQQSIRRIRHGAHGARWCLGMIVTVAAAACAPAPEPTHQTVEYYRVNKEARAAKLVECENDPGALGQTADCINARQAARKDMKSLRDLPPLNLPESIPGQRDSDERRSSGNSNPESR